MRGKVSISEELDLGRFCLSYTANVSADELEEV